MSKIFVGHSQYICIYIWIIDKDSNKCDGEYCYNTSHAFLTLGTWFFVVFERNIMEFQHYSVKR